MKLPYEITVVGEANVKRALDGIGRRSAVHNQQQQRQAQAAANREMNQARLLQGVQRFQHKQAVKAIKDQEAARIQSERRVAREKQHSIRQEERARAQALRREEKERIRASRLEDRERLAAARRSHRMMVADRASRERFARSAVGLVGGSVGGTVRAIGGTAVAALGLGGGMLIANSVKKMADAEKASAVLANKAYGVNGETRTRDQLKKDILGQARAIGVSTGLGTEGAVEGLRLYHAISGRMREGQAMLPFMADLADAYGADIGDVGRTGGQVMQTLEGRGVTGDEAVEKSRIILAKMAAQAKVGSIEFADLATQMGKLLSATTGFKGDITDLVSTMGAVAQLSIAGGASSPEEAMTSIMRFRDDIIKNSSKSFEAQGIDVFTDKSRTQLKDPTEILFQSLSKTKGDLVKFKSLFGIRAMKSASTFLAAMGAEGGGEKGIQVAHDLLMSKKNAEVTPEEVKLAAQATRETGAKQYDIAMAKLTDSLGNKFLPVLTRLIPEFEKLVPHIETGARLLLKFVEALATDPVGTLFKAIAAKLAFDIAAAGVGKHVTNAIVNSIAGSKIPPMGTGTGTVTKGGVVTTTGTSGGGGGPVKTPSNIGGAVSLGGTIGLTVATAIITAGVATFEAAEVRTDKAGSDLTKSRAAKAAGDVETAKQALDDIRKAKEEQTKPGVFESLVAGTVGTVGSKLMGWMGAEGDEKERANLAGKKTAEFFGFREPSAEKTLDTFETEALANLRAAQQKSAELQAQAAAKLDKAADKMLASAGPNRGNAPSQSPNPVK